MRRGKDREEIEENGSGRRTDESLEEMRKGTGEEGKERAWGN